MVRIVSAMILVTILSGCFATVTTDRRTFEPVPERTDTYSFKIYTGGIAGTTEARVRFDKEVSDFMSNEGYKSFEMIREKWVAFPLSGVEYMVKFTR